MLFKVIQHGYKTIQRVAPILQPVICSEINAASVKNKRLLQNEMGSYKFMFSLHTVTFVTQNYSKLYILYSNKFYVSKFILVRVVNFI